MSKEREDVRNINNKNENLGTTQGVDGQPMIEPDGPNKEDETKKNNPGQDLTDPDDKEDAGGRVPPA